MRNRINDLEADVVSQKSMADNKMKEMAEEAKEWKEKYESSEQLIKTGTDKYNSLKKEVETYRSLLEVEETRFAKFNVCSFTHMLQWNFNFFYKTRFFLNKKIKVENNTLTGSQSQAQPHLDHDLEFAQEAAHFGRKQSWLRKYFKMIKNQTWNKFYLLVKPWGFWSRSGRRVLWAAGWQR